jgi:hypothetical protein
MGAVRAQAKNTKLALLKKNGSFALNMVSVFWAFVLVFAMFF